MTAPKNMGLSGYHSIQFFVRDLDAAVKWHKEKFDFGEIARSTKDWEDRNQMKGVVLKGPKGIGWIFTSPISEGSSAGKWLARHPEGCAFLNFRVEDIKTAATFLAERSAPFLYDIKNVDSKDGFWRETAIATSIGEVGFRFIEEKNFAQFAPGFEWVANAQSVKESKFQFEEIDHVTINGRSMHGITEFCKSVMGFEQYWAVDFHTAHSKPELGTGSGLESIVVWDPYSQIKFATNQPMQPYFNNSQIEIYVEDNNGPGIQHLALSVKEIIPTVRALREYGCSLLETFDKYYQQLPKRIEENKIGKIKEPMEEIQKLGILVDGRDNKYLLQIFMKEMCEQLGNKKAGPFFYEIIQREGEKSFGDGNFKALFDSIETNQIVLNRQEMRDRTDSLV